MMKNLLIFASGSKDGGGSGFENLVKASKNGVLSANIVAVASNHEHGGVAQRAKKLGIPFIYFPAPWNAENYKKIVEDTKADFVALSGWLKMVVGLNPKTTFNIHPGPLPKFGGAGMYGHHVHEVVMEAYKRGEVKFSGVTMHFVTDDKQYDRGPIFFECQVPIEPNDTAETLAKRVNEAEHKWQPLITNKIVTGEISWDGSNRDSLKGYTKISL
jgi:folate-dependent phosphoribosylglycinamide formyltransferase PurN